MESMLSRSCPGAQLTRHGEVFHRVEDCFAHFINTRDVSIKKLAETQSMSANPSAKDVKEVKDVKYASAKKVCSCVILGV